MRLLSVRLIISLIRAVTLVSVFSAYYQVRGERRSLRNDLDRRAAVLADGLAGNLERYLEQGSTTKLQLLVERFADRERLAGVAVINERLEPIAQSAGVAELLHAQLAPVLARAVATR